MPGDEQPTLRRAPDGIGRTGEIVTAQTLPQHLVITGLDADFQFHQTVSGKLRQIIQHLIGQTIRPGTDHQPGNPGMTQGLLIDGLQMRQISVGIGIALKIRQKTARMRIAATHEFDAGINLLMQIALLAQVTG